jgi:hypothetical protein
VREASHDATVLPGTVPGTVTGTVRYQCTRYCPVRTRSVEGTGVPLIRGLRIFYIRPLHYIKGGTAGNSIEGRVERVSYSFLWDGYCQFSSQFSLPITISLLPTFIHK